MQWSLLKSSEEPSIFLLLLKLVMQKHSNRGSTYRGILYVQLLYPSRTSSTDLLHRVQEKDGFFGDEGHHAH